MGIRDNDKRETGDREETDGQRGILIDIVERQGQTEPVREGEREIDRRERRDRDKQKRRERDSACITRAELIPTRAVPIIARVWLRHWHACMPVLTYVCMYVC